MPISTPPDPAKKRCALAGACRMIRRGITRMKKPEHGFAEGDRVRAPRRQQFPRGAVVKLLEKGFVLVRWDGDVLETAHYSELEKAGDEESG
jgi:hypothetical protein